MMTEQQKPKRIPYGKQNWEDVRLSNFYYVDKTRFIPEIEAANEYFFFIRPRRFGKSLLMSMLRQYYDIRKADSFNYDKCLLMGSEVESVSEKQRVVDLLPT